jgi:tetraacyldisaccharide 4'-kinase
VSSARFGASRLAAIGKADPMDEGTAEGRAEGAADRRGPLPGWLTPLTWCAARLYGVGVAYRNARFDRGSGIARLDPAPVISVGNLSAGGTGKSPFVAWCARLLAEEGIQPVIAMRGYKVGPSTQSDEALEYARTAPMARVVVHPRRHEALESAFAGWSAVPALARAAVILDDGFQHRQLARDLDIVLVDATRPALDGDLLPHGWLREPARNIARADLVVLTKCRDDRVWAQAAALVERVRGHAHDAACDHVWSAVTVLEEGHTREEAVGWLSDRRVLCACALGNPRHFRSMVERAAGSIVGCIEQRDHAPLVAGELDAAARRLGADVVVVSRKDYVKLDRLPETTTVVPELALRFLAGERALQGAISAAAARRCAL